jgi:ABC-type sugar transport system ATPase subunit
LTRGGMLLAQSLEKTYGRTRALASCTVAVRPGEIHAVMGENGSGKSTLVKVLAGVQQPDGGGLELDGRAVQMLTPRMAQSLGIQTVFQEVLVSPNRSVLDNIWMGADKLIRSTGKAVARRDTARRTLEALVEIHDLDAMVGDLSLSERQAVCIARALVREPAVLILDEATSSLDLGVRDRLFAMLRDLRQAGCAILFISHRMDEVEVIADCATVMRAGRNVAELNRESVRAETIIPLMTGAQHLVQAEAGTSHRGPRATSEVAITVIGLRLYADSDPIDIEVHRGSIVGLAGLEGQGQTRFLSILAGLESAADGQVLSPSGSPIRSTGDAEREGFAYMPRDRQGESLLSTRSIVDNFAIVTAGTDRQGPLLSRRKARQRLQRYVKPLNIVLPGADAPIESLSGGNQQKVVIARWLSSQPRVLLLNDPTRGVDIGSKRDIYRVLRELSDGGMAVVMLSTELDELVELMDEVLVFKDQTVFAVHAGDAIRRETIANSYFGRALER